MPLNTLDRMELMQTTDIIIEIDVAGDPWVTREYGSTPADSADSLSQANGGHSNCEVTDKDTGQATVQEWEDPVQPSQVKLERNTSIVDSSSGCVYKGAKATGEPGVHRQPLTSPECVVFHRMEPYVKTESSEGREPHVYHMDFNVSRDTSLGEQKPYTEKWVDVEEGGMPFVCEMCQACFQSRRQMHKHMSAHSQSVQNPQAKLETGCEVKPGVQFLPGTISEPEVKPYVPAVTNTIASVSGCMKKGVKLELCTHSWLFQHPPDKLEPEDKVEPGIQLGHGSSSDSTTVNSTVGCMYYGVKLEPNIKDKHCVEPGASSVSTTVDSTVGCMYYGVKLEPDIKDKHCVKLEPGASSDSGLKLEPDISLKAMSGIKIEQQHSENGLGSVDCVHNSNVNMYQCQSEVKPDTVILCDSNVENLDAANCNVHSSGAGFVSVPLYESDKLAADLSLAPHSDLMTAAHSDLTTHNDLMTAAHSDLMTAAHSDLMTAAHSDLMTKVAEFSGRGSSVCLGGEASSQEPRFDTVEYHREQESKIQRVCGLCKKSFRSPRLLKQRMSTHTRQKPDIFATEQYTPVDNTYMDVQTPTDTPSSGRTCVCKHCKASFANPHHHSCTHKHECTDCSTCFPFARNLKARVLTQTGQKPHQCTECGVGFTQAGILKSHMLIHTGLKPQNCTKSGTNFTSAADLKRRMLVRRVHKSHMCIQCDASFSHAGSLKTHMFTHTGQKPHKCRECDASFNHAYRLKNHMITHTGQKPHKCTVCSASYSHSGSLKIHMFTHTGQKPHKCKECDAHFTDHSNMKTHMFTHTGQKPNKCTVCGVSFSRADSLKRHMFTHTGQKPHKCAVCGASFSLASHLKRHMFTHTGHNPHKCTVCGASFSQPGNLKRHMFTHTGQKPHKCKECDASFTNHINMRRHMFKHTGQKPHKCKECDASFNHVHSIKNYMLTHTGQKPHKCTVCGASFSQAGHLKMRMFTHTGQKPHKCKECDASFTNHSNMRRHMLKHTGQKPHKCTVCGASFTVSGSLKMHMFTHTGLKPHKCSVCGACFALAYRLKRHMLYTHRPETT